MADNRSIVITIKNQTGTGNSQDLDVSSKTSTASVSSKSDNDSMAKAAFAAMAIKTVKEIVNEVVAFADFKLDTYMDLTDDYIGQRNMMVAQHYINGATSMGGTVVNSTLSGFAIGGPIGAIVGAIVGFATASARNNRSNLQGKAQQDIELKQLDLQLQYTRRRVGWSTHAASIGEDL